MLPFRECAIESPLYILYKLFVGGEVSTVAISWFPMFLSPERAHPIIPVSVSVGILAVPFCPGVPRRLTNNCAFDKAVLL